MVWWGFRFWLFLLVILTFWRLADASIQNDLHGSAVCCLCMQNEVTNDLPIYLSYCATACDASDGSTLLPIRIKNTPQISQEYDMMY